MSPDFGLPTTEARTEQTDHKAHIQDNLSEGACPICYAPLGVTEFCPSCDQATDGMRDLAKIVLDREWHPGHLDAAGHSLRGAADAIESFRARVAGLVAERQELQKRIEELEHRLFPGQGESYANEVERQRVVIDGLMAVAEKRGAERDGLRARIRELAEQMEHDAAGQSDMLYGYSQVLAAVLSDDGSRDAND